MGGGGSKSNGGAVLAAKGGDGVAAGSPEASRVQLDGDAPLAKGSDAFAKYKEFRDQLLTFSMGESAYDFAEQLFEKEPENPEVMALLAETTVLYDQTKNKVYRDHWCDRLDLLQRGVDVSRKCFNEHPDYGPCYRTYVMCATRESEALYYWKSLTGVGLVENYHAIMRRGRQGMELLPDDAEIPNALGALCGRCAYRWYDPTNWYARYYGLPPASELRKLSIEFHKKACENNPKSLEYALRLAQAYFQHGDYPEARRWYIRVRDELPPVELKDERWQGVAHTQLSTSFARSKWNVPFA